MDGSTGDAAKKKEGNAGSQVEKGVIVPPASLTLISQGEDEEKGNSSTIIEGKNEMFRRGRSS